MRFGLLGTGHWARVTHGAAIAAHGGAELVGVWGRDPRNAAALADHYSARAYDDVDKLIADVDAVAIALPPDIQAPLAIRAARAGRHLLLDKPVALTVAAADELVEAVDGAGVASVVFFTNRFRPAVTDFLRTGVETGGWYSGRATMHASIFQSGNPYGASTWRREYGGLWDLGPHALSVLVPLLGPVEAVTAADGPRDTVHIVARHRGGAASTMSLTLDAAPAATVFEFVFFGERGVATAPADDARPMTTFGTAIDELLAQTGGGPVGHPCDVHFGRSVTAVLAAVDQARREGRTIAV